MYELLVSSNHNVASRQGNLQSAKSRRTTAHQWMAFASLTHLVHHWFPSARVGTAPPPDYYCCYCCYQQQQHTDRRRTFKVDTTAATTHGDDGDDDDVDGRPSLFITTPNHQSAMTTEYFFGKYRQTRDSFGTLFSHRSMPSGPSFFTRRPRRRPADIKPNSLFFLSLWPFSPQNPNNPFPSSYSSYSIWSALLRPVKARPIGRTPATTLEKDETDSGLYK